jgi:sporulation protein YlmC with PRC-barrel domain
MRVDLNAKVQTHDGKHAGSVQRAVLDPRTNEVTDFVVGTGGLTGKDVLVPRHDLETATPNGDVLRLDLTKHDLERLPTFDPTLYGEPPVGWSAPGLGYPFSGLLWPSSYLPAVNIPETIGSLSDEFTITKGTQVFDVRDEEVGVVEEVRVDALSGQLLGLVIRSGGALGTLFGRGQTVEVERAEIKRVADRMVFLSETKAELHQRFAKSELPR